MEHRVSRLNRRQLAVGLGILLGCVVGLAILTRARWSPVPASTASPVYRVGYLTSGSPEALARSTRFAAFRQQLAELGYVEGHNLVLETRFADAPSDRLPTIIDELVRLPVDVLVVAGSTVGDQAVKLAGTALPIVMAGSSDPVRARFIIDPLHPTGNVTGTTMAGSHLPSSQLTLLTQAVPGRRLVAVLGPADPDGASDFQEIRAAAAEIGIALQGVAARDGADLQASLVALAEGSADALVVLPSPLTNRYQSEILAFAREQGLPAIYGYREFVDQGGLMAYGPNLPELYRRAAYYVDRILRGAKPANLPVEQPVTFDFVVNLKTAKSLGLTFPSESMLQVTEVVE
jgi:putative ABC transport system substrate-binding protein